MLLQVEADSEVYSIITAAKAVAKRTHIEAEAKAHVMCLATEAEVAAVRIMAHTDADVKDEYVQEMGCWCQEISHVAMFDNKTIFVPTEAMGIAGPTLAGLVASIGVDLRK
jgi:hypothetical protein